MRSNYTRTILTVCVVAVTLGVSSLAIAATQYEPLAPVPGISEQGTTAGNYIINAFKLGIGIAAALAVLSIAWGGLQYMLSDVVTNKSAAISHIKNALLGLLLALASYLILQTINPALTNLQINSVVNPQSSSQNNPPGASGTW